MIIRTLCAAAIVLTGIAAHIDAQQQPSPVGPPHSQPAKMPPLTPPPAKKAEPTPVFHHLPSRHLPAMDKPFGMPGVVGFKDGKWEGADYLGHVANAMSVSVEVVKGESYEGAKIDENALYSQVAAMLKSNGITPQAEVKEGPPLPFVHVLLMVYPVDTEKVLIYGSVRLFEAVQVMRKNFAPAGYWQAITWESQDMTLSAASQAAEGAKALVDGLTKGFIERYKLYNTAADTATPKA